MLKILIFIGIVTIHYILVIGDAAVNDSLFTCVYNNERQLYG